MHRRDGASSPARAAEGLICSQAGIPPQAASKKFNDAFKAKYGEVKQYAPFFYDAVGIC